MTAAAAISAFLAGRKPAALIVLGSGLGDLAEHLSAPTRLAYRDIPGFPIPTVEGHKGELVLGQLAGRDVLAQAGRFHMYEGHDADTSALAVRTAAAVGIRTVMLTNAAGGIRRTFKPGTLMLIADHINLQFQSPLIGAVRSGETRFPDMSDPWDPALRALARDVARDRGIQLEEGVYAGLLGPSYETPAEVRMLEKLGADAVGMSTVERGPRRARAGHEMHGHLHRHQPRERHRPRSPLARRSDGDGPQCPTRHDLALHWHYRTAAH